MADKQDDEEISIDFSKVKNFFKGKSEKDKVIAAEKKAQEVKTELETTEDKKEVATIEKELKAQEDTAAIVDAEKKLIDKKIEEKKERLDQIEEKANEESDEEISFNFSKVKKFFSSDKKEKPKAEETKPTPAKESESKTTDDNDEEISFNFSKIKNAFSSNKTKKERKTESSEDMSVDWALIVALIKKYNVILLLLIPLIFAIAVRLTPVDLPLTDEWAHSTLVNNIQQQVANEVNQQAPNLPESQRNQIIAEQTNARINQNKAEFDQQVAQISEQFKSRMQKDGQTYLIAIDPYFWMRHAQNVLENGHPGDELRDKNTKEICEKQSSTCVPWDNHMLAPLGRAMPPDAFHAYLIATVHMILSIFNADQDLMSSTFYVPILLSALTIFPTFFITRRIAGNFGGFIAAMLIAIHPAFLTRTVGGFSDTDPYNVLFPLLITWLFLESFYTKKLKSTLSLIGIAGLLVAFYTVTWGGWWYIFNFLIISTVGYLLIYLLIHRSEIKTIYKQQTVIRSGVVLAGFFFSTLIFTILTSEFSTFKNAIIGPIGFLRFKEVGIGSIWPNVFTTVAEQNAASLDSVIGQIGTGWLIFFLLAVFGIVITIIKKDRNETFDYLYAGISFIWIWLVVILRPQNLSLFVSLMLLPVAIKIIYSIIKKETEIEFKLAIILIIWFGATLFASTRGIRFVLLLVPVAAIGIGIALSYITRTMAYLFEKYISVGQVFTKSILMVLFSLLLFVPLDASLSTAERELPSMNDAWYNALDKINQEAEPDAIINSWWDFGHWFKAIGDRAVTFDGTSQGTPMAHWIGHSLLTNNEDKSIGILRMLDCGSNNAYNVLNKEIDDGAKAVEILHEIVQYDKDRAQEVLESHVSSEKAQEVLEWSHCVPPENYFITSDDMIGKSGVWAHFGSWDFNRALMYNTLNQNEYRNDKDKSVAFLQDRFGLDQKQAEERFFEIRAIRDSGDANNWIAPWPSYGSNLNGCQQQNETIIICPIQGQGGSLAMAINFERKEAFIQSPQGIARPNAVVYPTPEGIEKITYNNNTLGFSVTLVPNGNSWSYIMMSPPLEDSMFTRLYFLEGHGLNKFRKFTEERSVINNRIVVWDVKWDSTEPHLAYFTAPEPVIEIVEAPPAEEEVEEIDSSEQEELVEESEEETESALDSQEEASESEE